jgi:hypothetical protein
MEEENEENKEAQNEEIEALQSIFGEDCVSVSGTYGDRRVLTVKLEHEKLRLLVKLSRFYPEKSPPEVSLVGRRDVEEENERVISKVLEYWSSTNDVMLFQLIEWIKETFVLETENEQDRDQEIKKDVKAQNDDDDDDDDDVNDDDDLILYHGEPMTDRRSTFQAHLCVVSSPQDAMRVLRKLYGMDAKIRRATHNIWAYRINDLSSNMIYSDNDDDGETAAGRRLALLLDTMEVKGAIVVVSRWYGGIHLGPARFRHINNVARDLIEKCGQSRRSDRRKKK